MAQVPTLPVRQPSWLQRFLPPVPERDVTWSGPEIILGIILVLMFLPALASSLLDLTGFDKYLYQAETARDACDIASVIGLAASPQSLPLVRVQAEATAVATQQLRLRFRLWIPLFILPLQVLALLALLRAVSRTRPIQLGFTWQHGWQNLGFGLAVSLFLIPLVNGLNFIVVEVLRHWAGVDVEMHPYFGLGSNLFPIEWLPLLFSVLVAAPVLEELTLRGLVQPWLVQRPLARLLVVGISLILAFEARLTGLKEALESGDWTQSALEVQPVLFVLLVAVGLAGVQMWSRSPAGPAIYTTALLFATLHSSVWPTPIALFVLGLGLGWLANRTQSLVGPMLVHCLFNAVGCLHFVLH
jgi:Type II CAAX prenyl endopeptidase Rce1-like